MSTGARRNARAEPARIATANTRIESGLRSAALTSHMVSVLLARSRRTAPGRQRPAPPEARHGEPRGARPHHRLQLVRVSAAHRPRRAPARAPLDSERAAVAPRFELPPA